MKSTGLLIAAIVLAALTGTLYWSNHRKPADPETKASADAPPKILSLKQEDISRIDIRKRDRETLTLAKNNAGKWQIISPQPFGADQETVSSMLYTLSSLNSDRLIEEKAADLETYGLHQPFLEVDVTEKNNKTDRLLIGDDTPTGSSVYAALAGDPRIFTVASYNKNSVDKGVKDLRDKRLLTFEADKLSRVELIANKQGIEFGRNKDQWQIVKPEPLRADDFQVEDLIRKLKDAKMDLSGSEEDAKKRAAAFSSGAPVGTARVTDTSGTLELQIRKKKDEYYAKSSAVEGAFKVSSDLGQALDKSVEDFRTKKLFDFGFADSEKIEVHDGSKAYYLTKGGDDWWADGKKMDTASVYPVLEKVRDLTASKFVESGFTSPVLEISVTSNAGKRIEKVLIAKEGDHFVAKRESEPALYQLDSGAVSDLQKAAAEVKLAPPPEAKPAKGRK